MKLSKILLASAVAAAMVFGIMGCAQVEDEHGILNVSGDTATIDFTNDGEETYRGFRTLKTKHTDAVALVTIDPSKATAADGVFGFVFDLDKDKKVKNTAGEEKDVYDFSSVAVRYSNGALQTYISRFEGVDPKNMDGGANFKDVDGKELKTADKTIGGHNAKETEVLKGGKTAAYATLTGVTPNADGTYTVAIEVIADKNGTYTVTYYDGKDATVTEKEEVDEEGNKVKTGQISSGAKALTVTGTASNGVTVDASWKKEGLTKPKQTYMGFYAAVYKEGNLKGTIQLPYILNEDEVVEWED